MYNIEKRVKALEALLNQIFRVGEIDSIDPAAGTARAILPDSGNVVSHPLPVLSQKAHLDKFYTMPDIGEQVLCVFLPNGLEQGFILGSMFSQIVSPPVSNPDKTHMKFKDGTTLEYDRATHKLTGQVQGDIDLNATKSAKIKAPAVDVIASAVVTLAAPQINLSGNISATAPGGGVATEVKVVNTQQTGNFTLKGSLHVEGDITCTGSNPNKHSH